MRSAGTSPRQATQPVKRGFSGPKMRWRTREWMPSAPITRSASTDAPFSKRAIDPLALLLQADQPVADMQPARRHGGRQQLGQVAAMEVIVGRAEVPPRPPARAAPAAGCGRRPSAADGRRRGRTPTASIAGFRPEPDQQPRGVGADLDAGADFADARRLLVDVDVEPGLQKMQRGGESADAAADHRDLEAHASGFRCTCWTDEIG